MPPNLRHIYIKRTPSQTYFTGVWSNGFQLNRFVKDPTKTSNTMLHNVAALRNVVAYMSEIVY